MGERAGVGERLVTVLLTLAVPQTTDPEDAGGCPEFRGTSVAVR